MAKNKQTYRICEECGRLRRRTLKFRGKVLCVYCRRRALGWLPEIKERRLKWKKESK